MISASGERQEAGQLKREKKKVKRASLAFLLSLWASLASAQNINIDFEAIAPGTLAEAIAIPGVTFSSTPAGGWVVFATTGFATLPGNTLFVPIGAPVLTIDFATPRNGYRFNFATNGAETVQVAGFLGATPVFTNTFNGSIPPGVGSPEGVAAGAGIAYDRLVIQTLGGQEMAIDNLAATVSTQIPTLSEWGLILLAGLMGIGAYARMRRTG